MSLDEDVCFIQKIVNKPGAFEFYNINAYDNPLRMCYYECDGKKLVCHNRGEYRLGEERK